MSSATIILPERFDNSRRSARGMVHKHVPMGTQTLIVDAAECVLALPAPVDEVVKVAVQRGVLDILVEGALEMTVRQAFLWSHARRGTRRLELTW